MARRMKEEVLSELPPKRRAKVRLELSPAEMKKVNDQKKLIQDYEEKISEALEVNEEDEGFGLPTPEVMKVFKLLCQRISYGAHLSAK